MLAVLSQTKPSLRHIAKMTAAGIRIFVSLVVLSSCAQGQLRKRRRRSLASIEIGGGFIQSQYEGDKSAGADLMDVIVRFKKPDPGSFAAQTFSQEVEALESMSGCFNALSEPVTVHTMIPALSSAGVRVSAKTLNELKADPMVELIEPNGQVYPHVEAASYGVTMAMGDSDVPAYSGPTMDCSDSNAIKIAVLDGGLDITHSDFAFCGLDSNGQATNGAARCMGERFFETDASTNDQQWYNSRNSHGTHVAGIAAASGLNGKGAMGIISDGNICLLIGRIFNDAGTGASYTAVSAAIEWAIQQNVKVINMSFGTPETTSLIKDAVAQAASSGVILVASSGNSAHLGNPLNYPAAYESTISVAAVDNNKQWAFFSTFNDAVDISAAGVDIFSSVPGNTVGAKSGTSMAAPLVAGTAALLFRQCPSCGRSEVEDCLLATAAPLDCPRYMCGVGLLQTSAAMTCITSQSCCDGEYSSGTLYDNGAAETSNTDSTHTYIDYGNTNIAKGSTNTKVETEKIPSAGGGAGAGGGAAKETQDKNDAKENNKNDKEDSEDYDAWEDIPMPGSETCLASKSGCYLPTMCCSGVCEFGSYASIGKCL